MVTVITNRKSTGMKISGVRKNTNHKSTGMKISGVRKNIVCPTIHNTQLLSIIMVLRTDMKIITGRKNKNHKSTHEN